MKSEEVDRILDNLRYTARLADSTLSKPFLSRGIEICETREDLLELRIKISWKYFYLLSGILRGVPEYGIYKVDVVEQMLGDSKEEKSFRYDYAIREMYKYALFVAQVVDVSSEGADFLRGMLKCREEQMSLLL